MALATHSIVAWRLLWLTYLARCYPTSSCEEVLEQLLVTGFVWDYTPPTISSFSTTDPG